MAIGPRLDIRQTQQLVMTPQLQQAIKLLTLTNLELEAAVGSEIDRNPLLDSGEIETTGSIDVAEPLAAGDVGVDKMLGVEPGSGAADQALDMDVNEAVFHHDSAADCMGQAAASAGGLDGGLSLNGGGAVGSNGGHADEEGLGFEALLADDKSLQDYLRDQAGQTFVEATERLIALHLVDLVDDAGYIAEPLDTIADRLNVPLAITEQVLGRMQQFEPVGVCARSLSECLKLQAREADRLDPAMECLLDNLELLARGDLPTLKRLCRVDHEDLADMIRELRGYNPKPGLVFGGERAQTVVPDVFIRKTASGAWGVELNTATLPRVLVNQSYYAELSGKAATRADKQFLTEMLTSANWLVKALDQRARTILKVASEIVRQQEAFFEIGVRGLRPLTLRTVADAISMHESTVSRVTTAKYLSCARGLFELKYFFTSSISSGDGGEALSSQSVKQRIKELIDAEDMKHVLSDDQLVDILQREKYDIARRTVAKYREALHIPSSVQRRRLKAFG
jgi:RNA polymerase sigma-54 factor